MIPSLLSARARSRHGFSRRLACFNRLSSPVFFSAPHPMPVQPQQCRVFPQGDTRIKRSIRCMAVSPVEALATTFGNAH